MPPLFLYFFFFPDFLYQDFHIFSYQIFIDINLNCSGLDSCLYQNHGIKITKMWQFNIYKWMLNLDKETSKIELLLRIK